jgi:NADH-quinone oxidoreductase subunit C
MSDFLANIPCIASAPQDAARTGLVFAALVAPSEVRAAAVLCRDEGYHIEDVTVSEVQEGTLVLYHFDRFEAPGRISVMALAPSNTIETISDIFTGADWHERECFDFYGTVFTGHPNLLPLLLPPDVQVPPLRKGDASKVSLGTLFPWAAPAGQKEA